MEPLGIRITQRRIKIPEIQSSHVEDIALDKAQKAFAKLEQPLFVNDTSWQITALNGFPGPYARHVNKWLTAQDWIDLLQRHSNREIILRQIVTYIDKDVAKSFIYDTRGVILVAPRGNPKFGGFDQVVSMVADGQSLAEEHEAHGYSLAKEIPLWKQFADWLLTAMVY